ncbi:MAG: 50S ribosomal protein L4 [Myxococcota bacterium]
MPKITVYDLNKQSVGELNLSEDVFGAEVNEGLFYEVLKAQLASKRGGAHSTKSRTEVRGSGQKMYRQKGTGRARHGDEKAPSFVGGGQAHGPKPRDYSYRPPRKMRLGALRSALSMKLRNGQLTVVDDFGLDEIKTKKLAKILSTLEADGSSLIVDGVGNEKLRLSARNLRAHQYLPPEGLNLYDLLRHDHLVVTKAAVEAIEARCKF